MLTPLEKISARIIIRDYKHELRFPFTDLCHVPCSCNPISNQRLRWYRNIREMWCNECYESVAGIESEFFVIRLMEIYDLTEEDFYPPSPTYGPDFS